MRMFARNRGLLLLATLEHNNANDDADDGHNRNSTDDHHGVVARLGQGLTSGFLARLGLVGRLRRGRCLLVLLPLGEKRYRSGKLNLCASLIARAGTICSRVPAHKGITLTHRFIGRDLGLGNVLDSSKLSGLLIRGAVQVVGEVVSRLLELRLGKAAVLALGGSRTSPGASAV